MSFFFFKNQRWAKIFHMTSSQAEANSVNLTETKNETIKHPHQNYVIIWSN